MDVMAVSDSLTAAVEQVGQSVVRVEARRRIPASGIVWSTDGLVVTADHTVQRDDRIAVGLPGGSAVSATLVGRDPTTDLAVLRAETGALHAAPWAESAGLRVGQLVLALGRPGQTVRAVLGILSVVGDGWRTMGGAQVERYLQADADLPAGFSGGPLVDLRGRIVGLNTSGLARHPLTIPAQTLRRVVEALVAHGRIRRGYLGVGVQPVRLPEAIKSTTGQDTGLLVISVEPGSPAEQARLVLGDTLLALGGQPLRRPADLVAFLGADKIGSSGAAQVLRGGQVVDLSVTVGERS